MSCQNACYRKLRDVRVRGVPEQAMCLVYTPDDPEIYELNPSAWLILDLCRNSPEADIAEAYHKAVEPLLSKEDALSEVRAGLGYLMEKGIIELGSK